MSKTGAQTNVMEYNKQGGTKLQAVYPPGLVQKFKYLGVQGAMHVDLANFGRF